MPTTDTPIRRGAEVPRSEAQYLERLTAKIAAADDAIDARAQRIARLHEAGYSWDALAKAAGITREAARKSTLRWLDRQNGDS